MIITAAFLLSAFANTGDKLTGRWQTHPSPKGNVTTVYFKEDKTFDGFINKKPFNTGQYSFENDTFTFTDNGCDKLQGIYKVIFFSKEDSMRFEVISDSCAPRREGMLKLVMGRIKTPQP